MVAVKNLRRLLAGLLLLVTLPALGAVHSEPLDPGLQLHSTPDHCPPQKEHQCLACNALRHAAPPAVSAFFAPVPHVARFVASAWSEARYQFVLAVALGRAPPALL
jgi:hypothetical protein